jgi:CheY-like chemotaxis protein
LNRANAFIQAVSTQIETLGLIVHMRACSVVGQGGCEAYLSKPISVAKFIETVKTYIGDA